MLTFPASFRFVVGVGLLERFRPQLNVLAGTNGAAFIEQSYSSIDALNLQTEMLSTLCFSSCGRGMYELEPCAGDHDQVCVPITNCSTDEFQMIPANATQDAVCANLTLCNPLFTPNGSVVPDPRCEVADSALCAQLDPSNCTSNAGNATVAISRCPFLCNECGKYLSGVETAVSDRQCGLISLCNLSISFVSTEATPTSDRVCQPLTVCDSGLTFESRPAAYRDDRECSSCTVCSVGVEYETLPCTATTDRVCANFSVCSSSQFEVTAPTQSSDRECSNITTCSLQPQEFIQFSATVTTDAVCAPCTICESTAADVLFVIDTSSSIEDPAFGGSSGTFNFVKDFVRNITESITNVGGDFVNGTRIAAITFDSTAQIVFDFGGGSIGPSGFTRGDVISKVDNLLLCVSCGVHAEARERRPNNACVFL